MSRGRLSLSLKYSFVTHKKGSRKNIKNMYCTYKFYFKFTCSKLLNEDYIP